MKQKILRTIWYAYVILTGFICGLLLMALLSSCRSISTHEARTAVSHVTADTLRLYHVQRDSIYLRDSVFVSQQQRGDTVWLTKVVTKLQLRDRLRRDTVNRVAIDTLRDTVFIANTTVSPAPSAKLAPSWLLTATWLALCVAAAYVAVVLHKRLEK